jgi:hypothetical protein
MELKRDFHARVDCKAIRQEHMIVIASDGLDQHLCVHEGKLAGLH